MQRKFLDCPNNDDYDNDNNIGASFMYFVSCMVSCTLIDISSSNAPRPPNQFTKKNVHQIWKQHTNNNTYCSLLNFFSYRNHQIPVAPAIKFEKKLRLCVKQQFRRNLDGMIPLVSNRHFWHLIWKFLSLFIIISLSLPWFVWIDLKNRLD